MYIFIRKPYSGGKLLRGVCVSYRENHAVPAFLPLIMIFLLCLWVIKKTKKKTYCKYTAQTNAFTVLVIMMMAKSN